MNTLHLSRRLESYPHLRETLGAKWVEEQDRIDPIVSPYPLARWLRMDGFAPGLATLDQVLGQLASLPGIAARRQRIRADAPALMETLTELYFGAWLLERGYRFNWPKQGADFDIYLGTDRSVRAEATTPRKAVWLDDLFERLHLVTRRTGFSAELQHSRESLPDPALSEDVVAHIVQQALADLQIVSTVATRQKFSQVVQDYAEYGLKITWTPAADPHIAATVSPGPTSPYAGFWYIVAAARAKAHQLPEDEAGALIIGTRHLPDLAWEHFLDALRYYRPEDMQFDWAQIPGQVKYVIVYSVVLRQITPFEALWFTNPASPLPDLPGALEMPRDLFPFPLRPRDVD